MFCHANLEEFLLMLVFIIMVTCACSGFESKYNLYIAAVIQEVTLLLLTS